MHKSKSHYHEPQLTRLTCQLLHRNAVAHRVAEPIHPLCHCVEEGGSAARTLRRCAFCQLLLLVVVEGAHRLLGMPSQGLELLQVRQVLPHRLQYRQLIDQSRHVGRYRHASACGAQLQRHLLVRRSRGCRQLLLQAPSLLLQRAQVRLQLLQVRQRRVGIRALRGALCPCCNGVLLAVVGRMVLRPWLRVACSRCGTAIIGVSICGAGRPSCTCTAFGIICSPSCTASVVSCCGAV